jgi:penicillin-binding protein 1A
LTVNQPVGAESSLAPHRSRWRRVLRGAGLVLLAMAGVLLVIAAVVWFATPSGNDLQVRLRAMAAGEGTTLLAPDAVPPLLAQAITATEDERFYQNHGVDVIGLARAALYDISHLCACQGGSTITQQLAKEVYLNGSDAGINKLADLALALKLSLQYSKGQILADYLSIVPTGFGRWGMANAACADFHRPLGSLDLGEAALLAGLPQAPAVYDPLLHPDAAADRRRDVLADMVSQGDISTAQAAQAAAEPVSLPASAGGC